MFGENLQAIWDALPENRKQLIDARFHEMEGDLEMVVRFADRPPVILKGFGFLNSSNATHKPA
jgi:hypothetical protein